MHSFQLMGCWIVLKLLAGCRIQTASDTFGNLTRQVGKKILKVTGSWDDSKTSDGMQDLKKPTLEPHGITDCFPSFATVTNHMFIS